MTRPTTIKAITEIPAKTARPIGRTESFWPGSTNAAVLVDAESAADVAEVAADDDAEGFGLPPAAFAGTADDPAADAVADDAAAELETEAAGLAVETADAATEEGPLATTPDSVAVEEALLALGVADAEADAEIEAADTVGTAVTVETPLTTTPDSLATEVVGEADTVDEPEGGTVIAPVGWEADEADESVGAALDVAASVAEDAEAEAESDAVGVGAAL